MLGNDAVLRIDWQNRSPSSSGTSSRQLLLGVTPYRRCHLHGHLRGDAHPACTHREGNAQVRPGRRNAGRQDGQAHHRGERGRHHQAPRRADARGIHVQILEGLAVRSGSRLQGGGRPCLHGRVGEERDVGHQRFRKEIALPATGDDSAAALTLCALMALASLASLAGSATLRRRGAVYKGKHSAR